MLTKLKDSHDSASNCNLRVVLELEEEMCTVEIFAMHLRLVCDLLVFRLFFGSLELLHRFVLFETPSLSLPRSNTSQLSKHLNVYGIS